MWLPLVLLFDLCTFDVYCPLFFSFPVFILPLLTLLCFFSSLFWRFSFNRVLRGWLSSLNNLSSLLFSKEVTSTFYFEDPNWFLFKKETHVSFCFSNALQTNILINPKWWRLEKGFCVFFLTRWLILTKLLYKKVWKIQSHFRFEMK